MTLEIGQLIEGKYRIARLIGEGGMGAVYEGENVRINRRVAIKVLHAAFTGNAEVMQRFEREAQAAGRIGNDHILEVLDLGSLGDGDHYIVMEFLDGQPLSERIKSKGKLSPHDLAPIARQVLVGLGAAHQAGIVHRDLKPDNIYILHEKAGVRDYVKIIDFGISKFQPLSGDGMKMTRTGTVMGTPYYMSPEQASGSHEADQRSDLYTMGVIMFEAVTGNVPFDAATFNQLMFKIVLAEVPVIESVVPGIDPAFSSIVSKAMARDVTHRFQTAAEFIRAIDDWSARGTAVSIPPPGDAVTAGFVPQGRATMSSATGVGQAAPGGKTAGNWATSQPDALPPMKKRSALPVFAAIGALLVAGGAVAAFKVIGKPTQPSTDVTAAPASSPPPVQAPPPGPKVESAPKVEPTPQPDVAPVASAPASAAPTPAKIARPASPPPAVRSPSRLPARPATKAGKKPETAPATKPGSSPDFGY
jgi:serine/threonine protein kinase